MNHIIELVQTTIELGLIYSLVTLATHISSQIIKFDDLTTEGSFASGGAITACLLMLNLPVWLTLIIAIGIGSLIGMLTGILHTKLQLNNLISGIVVSTALFSLNLKIAGSNLVLEQQQSIFATLSAWHLTPISILAAISIGCILLIHRLLKTEIGALIKTVGSNPQLLLSLGKSVTTYKIISLMIANGITALAGCLLVHYTGFFSITGSIGTLIIALAGLIIGQALCKNNLWGTLIGALGYQAVIALTIELQLDPAWNKLITAVLIVMLIALRNTKTTHLVKG